MMAARSIGGDVRMPFELQEMVGSNWSVGGHKKKRLNGREEREWWDEMAVFTLAWIFWALEVSRFRPTIGLCFAVVFDLVRRLFDVTL